MAALGLCDEVFKANFDSSLILSTRLQARRLSPRLMIRSPQVAVFVGFGPDEYAVFFEVQHLDRA